MAATAVALQRQTAVRGSEVAAMGTYLEDNPPRQRQFRERRAKVTGLIVVHTAESAPDETGPDTGTENVARFIRDRSTYGSYHTLADSDSRLRLVPFHLAAYGDGTGSNEFAIHISAATQAARWRSLPRAWRRGCVKQLAAAAAEAARWLQKEHGITVPARRVNKADSDRGAAGFISHGERDPGRRSDPGADFPWALFLAEFERLMAGRRLRRPLAVRRAIRAATDALPHLSPQDQERVRRALRWLRKIPKR